MTEAAKGVMRRLLTACEPFSASAVVRAKRRSYARLWAAWMGWDVEVKAGGKYEWD